jgi:3',5'-cyclic-AMP phosphodiesterase
MPMSRNIGATATAASPAKCAIRATTARNAVGDDQLAWLERELKPASTVVLFVHHPVLAIDTPLDQAGAALKDREKLKALLTVAGCDIFAFCGHYHMDDERSEANIRQFVTPAVSY